MTRSELTNILLIVLSFIALMVLTWLLSGCSAMEKSGQNSGSTAERLAARNNMAIERIVEGDKRPTTFIKIDVSGSSNVVTVPFPGVGSHNERLSLTSADNQNASSDASWLSTFKQHWPIWISGLGCVVAVGLALLVWKAVKKEFPAVAAAQKAGEAIVVRQIEKIEDKMAVAKDDREIAELALEKAKLEKERGQLKATKP